MRKNEPEHNEAVKGVCDTIGYSGVLTCLLKIAEDNHERSVWRTDEIEKRHFKQIKVINKALRKVNSNNQKVDVILYGRD